MYSTTQNYTEVGRIELRMDQQKPLISHVLDFIANTMQARVNADKLNVTLSRRYFDEMFGACTDRKADKTISEVLAPDELVQVISQQTDGDASIVLPLEDETVDGEQLFVANITQREPQTLEVVIYDVKEEEEKQERLYLNDRLASIGEMAAGIAHELNNPLTSIIMLSQSILQENIPEELKRDMNDINNEALRASEVVKNLLAFARKQTPARHLTQINKTIIDVMKLREYEQRVSNIKVVTQFEPDLPEIMVDPYQMQQVFLNIMLNAEQAITESNTGDTIAITTIRGGSAIKVSVVDNGPGIPPENLKKIFYPFYTTKQVGKGTGLGLSICKSIINSHGGKIYAQSEPGKGAAFIIELPLNTGSNKLVTNG